MTFYAKEGSKNNCWLKTNVETRKVRTRSGFPISGYKCSFKPSPLLDTRLGPNDLFMPSIQELPGLCGDHDECATVSNFFRKYFLPLLIFAKKTHQCSPLADCINTIGAYECKCRNAWLGDGKSCYSTNLCTTRPRFMTKYLNFVKNFFLFFVLSLQ